MSTSRYLPLCALLAGCNPVFGLDETVPVDAVFIDFDHDGVTDSKDNCPTTANAEQMDSDGDGFGDACDSCRTVASATNHDEDGDLVGDACDLCPGIEDFNDDSDLDGLGDICDPAKDTAGNVRLAFETFETMPPEWQAAGGGWSHLDDAVAPMATVSLTDSGLTNTALAASAPFVATIGYDSFAPWKPMTEKAGIDVAANGHTIRCLQHCPTAYCEGLIYMDGAVLAATQPARPSPRSRLTMRLATTTISCAWDSAALATTLSPGVMFSGRATISVIGDPGVHITYFELVQ